MKRLLAASALLVALAGPSWAGDAPGESFVGKWALVSQTNADDKRTALLTVSEKDGKYSVSIGLAPGQTMPEGQAVPTFNISKVMVKGDMLTFHCDVDTKSEQGVVPVDYMLKINNDALTGEVRNGQGTSRQLTATRQ